MSDKKTCLPVSICQNCVRPLRECDYLMKSELNKPCFYEGSRHMEAEIAASKNRKLTVYIMTYCPQYLPPPAADDRKRVRRLTQAERDQMRELRAEGMTYEMIAERVGRHWTTVRDHLRRLNKKEKENETDEMIIGDLRREILALGRSKKKEKPCKAENGGKSNA